MRDMDTAKRTATHRCLVFLHPAAASNPAIIREIHAATGLMAVAGSNIRAASLVRPEPHDGFPFGGGAA